MENDREAEIAAHHSAAVVTTQNPLRVSGVNAADMLWRGSPSARAGFNHGVSWAIAQIASSHKEAWAQIVADWGDDAHLISSQSQPK